MQICLDLSKTSSALPPMNDGPICNLLMKPPRIIVSLFPNAFSRLMEIVLTGRGIL